ncbi:MAG: hypothetical protein H7141_01175 [Burkholderiales bacterium]|nr:hypothetical protein [Bacteroidia bacterium]
MIYDTSTYSVVETYVDNASLVELWDNNIIHIKLKDNIQIELEDSKKQHLFLKSKFDGVNKHLILVETGTYTTISKEAREFSTQPATNDITRATAVIVKSLAHRIIINFIINLTNQQSMKMRMFEDRQKAINWLLDFKNT